MKNLFLILAAQFSGRVGKASPCPPITAPLRQIKPAHPTLLLLIAIFIFSSALILPYHIRVVILNNYIHITGANQ